MRDAVYPAAFLAFVRGFVQARGSAATLGQALNLLKAEGEAALAAYAGLQSGARIAATLAGLEAVWPRSTPLREIVKPGTVPPLTGYQTGFQGAAATTAVSGRTARKNWSNDEEGVDPADDAETALRSRAASLTEGRRWAEVHAGLSRIYRGGVLGCLALAAVAIGGALSRYAYILDFNTPWERSRFSVGDLGFVLMVMAAAAAALAFVQQVAGQRVCRAVLGTPERGLLSASLLCYLLALLLTPISGLAFFFLKDSDWDSTRLATLVVAVPLAALVVGFLLFVAALCRIATRIREIWLAVIGGAYLVFKTITVLGWLALFLLAGEAAPSPRVPRSEEDAVWLIAVFLVGVIVSALDLVWFLAVVFEVRSAVAFSNPAVIDAKPRNEDLGPAEHGIDAR